MALNSQSLILYNFNVTTLNQNLDFKASSGGPILTAVINLGYYSLTDLLTAVVTAIQNADTMNTYTATANRTLMGGLQNRVALTSSSAYFSLLFNSGPSVHTSIGTLLGFNPVDYTGATSYIGSSSAGTTLVPVFNGYNYVDFVQQAKVFGAVNVSASGLKEAVTFNIQYFLDVEFKYEPKANLPAWQAFWGWAIQQRPFDFTPEISSPTVFYEVTVEKTSFDPKGMGFQMKEMLPNFPNFYQTGPIDMRVNPNSISSTFIT